MADPAVNLANLAPKYYGVLRRFFQRRILEQSDIDDLIQDVFLRLTRRGIEDINNFEGYLFETAANVLRDRQRHRIAHRLDRQVPVDPEFIQDAAFSPERVLLGKEAVAEMSAALRALPERTQMVFVLGRFEDLQHGEIARRLGISKSAVEKHMMKALAYISRRIGKVP